jgi:DNA-binding winged helix-turn-helix (wHTH) protein
MSDPDQMTESLIVIAARAANEGIPTAAIARVIQRPFDAVAEVLTYALSIGQISEMPKADWPPGAPWRERIPTAPRVMTEDDLEFACDRVFHLTPLERGFIVALLRFEYVDKDRLFNIVEDQRFRRRPNKELADKKMVDVMICKLRKKLRDCDPTLVIMTSWGKGYYFDPAVKQKIYALIGGQYGSASRNGPDLQRGRYPSGVGQSAEVCSHS